MITFDHAMCYGAVNARPAATVGWRREASPGRAKQLS